MACTAPPGKPDSVAHRSRMYCDRDRSAARASRQVTMVAPTPTARTEVSRSTPAMRLREVLEPFNNDLDVRPRRLVRVPEVIKVHSHAFSSRRRHTGSELVLRDDIRPRCTLPP